MPLPFLFSCANVAIGDDFSHHPVDSGRQPPAIIVQETVPAVPTGVQSDVAVFIARTLRRTSDRVRAGSWFGQASTFGSGFRPSIQRQLRSMESQSAAFEANSRLRYFRRNLTSCQTVCLI